LATGLEDYGRWKGMFQDQKREGKPPFPRRGRIWA
jgi:cyanobactin cluster PatC/TenC/TruC protein